MSVTVDQLLGPQSFALLETQSTGKTSVTRVPDQACTGQRQLVILDAMPMSPARPPAH